MTSSLFDELDDFNNQSVIIRCFVSRYPDISNDKMAELIIKKHPLYFGTLKRCKHLVASYRRQFDKGKKKNADNI